MAGATKHIFDHDVRDIIGMLNKQLADIKHVLPRTYSTEAVSYTHLTLPTNSLV